MLDGIRLGRLGGEVGLPFRHIQVSTDEADISGTVIDHNNGLPGRQARLSVSLRTPSLGEESHARRSFIEATLSAPEVGVELGGILEHPVLAEAVSALAVAKAMKGQLTQVPEAGAE
jgi:hypothetical protein